MIVREHISINEQYDSPLEKKFNFSKDDLQQMAYADPYSKDKSANLFQHGLYHGKASLELNDLISQATFKSFDHNAIGFIEDLYRILVKFIPEFKQFEINKYSAESPIKHLNLKREIILKDEVSGKEYKINIDLWIVYHTKNDKIFNYKKDKIKVLFSPSINTENFNRPEAISLNKKLPSLSFTDYELEDKAINKELNKLQRSLSSTPDNEDLAMIEKVKISYNNLTFASFIKLIPKLQKNLNQFNIYIKHKYFS